MIGRWLAPAGELGAFAPTPAAICGGCGLGVGRTASLVREPGSGTALCPICRLGRDPATPSGALVLAWLPEFAQGELNRLYTSPTPES